MLIKNQNIIVFQKDTFKFFLPFPFKQNVPLTNKCFFAIKERPCKREIKRLGGRSLLFRGQNDPSAGNNISIVLLIFFNPATRDNHNFIWILI